MRHKRQMWEQVPDLVQLVNIRLVNLQIQQVKEQLPVDTREKAGKSELHLELPLTQNVDIQHRLNHKHVTLLYTVSFSKW